MQIMLIKTFSFSLEEYDSMEALPPKERELLKAAKNTLENAYAPYSKFYVGAAVRLTNGKIIVGNNQENAAYPSGLCAERVALFAANAVYPDQRVESIAITAKNALQLLDTPIPPCGACRQVIGETEHRFGEPIQLILQGETGKVWVLPSLESILPFGFDSSYLEQK